MKSQSGKFINFYMKSQNLSYINTQKHSMYNSENWENYDILSEGNPCDIFWILNLLLFIIYTFVYFTYTFYYNSLYYNFFVCENSSKILQLRTQDIST